MAKPENLEKYIKFIAGAAKPFRVSVSIASFAPIKPFETLEQAREYRDERLEKRGIYHTKAPERSLKRLEHKMRQECNKSRKAGLAQRIKEVGMRTIPSDLWF